MEDQLIIKLFFQRSENAIEELAQKYGKLCNAISINILKNKEKLHKIVVWFCFFCYDKYV